MGRKFGNSPREESHYHLTMNLYRSQNVPSLNPKQIAQRNLAWEPATFVNFISVALALAFIAFLPLRVKKLRTSRTKNALSWEGRSKVVSIHRLLSISGCTMPIMTTGTWNIAIVSSVDICRSCNRAE